MKSIFLLFITALVLSCSSYKNTKPTDAYPVDPLCSKNIKEYVDKNQNLISGNYVDRFSVIRMRTSNQNIYDVTLIWDSGKNAGKTWRKGFRVNKDCEVINFKDKITL